MRPAQPSGAMRTVRPRRSAPGPEARPGPALRPAPRTRESVTRAFTVGEARGFLIASHHRDGALSDINLIMAKHGSTMNGLCDSLATAISTGLAHGVPLATFVRRFSGLRFPPGGPTDDPEIPHASSVIDYIVRRLAADYLSADSLPADPAPVDTGAVLTASTPPPDGGRHAVPTQTAPGRLRTDTPGSWS